MKDKMDSEKGHEYTMYKIVRGGADLSAPGEWVDGRIITPFEARLNEAGKEGWTLVSTTWVEEGGCCHKRLIGVALMGKAETLFNATFCTNAAKEAQDEQEAPDA